MFDAKQIERAKALVKEHAARHPNAARLAAAGRVPEVEFPLTPEDAAVFGVPERNRAGTPTRMNTAWLDREVLAAENAAFEERQRLAKEQPAPKPRKAAGKGDGEKFDHAPEA